MPSGQNIGFGAWTPVIDADKTEITMSKIHVVYIAEVDSGIKAKYNEIYGSKLVTPEEKIDSLNYDYEI